MAITHILGGQKSLHVSWFWGPMVVTYLLGISGISPFKGLLGGLEKSLQVILSDVFLNLTELLDA